MHSVAGLYQGTTSVVPISHLFCHPERTFSPRGIYPSHCFRSLPRHPNRKDPLRSAPGGSFRLAVGIGLRLSTLVASANQLDSISSDASIRAEALSLSHLTWDTTVTIRFHIFWITLLSSVRRQYHPPQARSNPGDVDPTPITDLEPPTLFLS